MGKLFIVFAFIVASISNFGNILSQAINYAKSLAQDTVNIARSGASSSFNFLSEIVSSIQDLITTQNIVDTKLSKSAKALDSLGNDINSSLKNIKNININNKIKIGGLIEAIRILTDISTQYATRSAEVSQLTNLALKFVNNDNNLFNIQKVINKSNNDIEFAKKALLKLKEENIAIKDISRKVENAITISELKSTEKPITIDELKEQLNNVFKHLKNIIKQAAIIENINEKVSNVTLKTLAEFENIKINKYTEAAARSAAKAKWISEQTVDSLDTILKLIKQQT